MSIYTYEAKAWKELNKLVKEAAKTDDSFKQFQAFMNEIVYEESRKPTKGEEIAEIVSDFVCSCSYDSKGFVDKVTTSHRTLQQSMFNLFLGCMKEWAECDSANFYDARNENTIKASVKVKKLLENDTFPMI